MLLRLFIVEEDYNMRVDRALLTEGISRRVLLASCVSAASLALMSCTTATSSPQGGRRPDDLRIARFMDGYSAVARREPTLPGARSLEEIATNVLGRFSPSDQAFLADVMYVEARDVLRRSRRPVSEAAIRRALVAPVDAGRVSPEYFIGKVAEARSRMESDRAYGEALMIRANDPFFHGRCEDELTGETVPCAMWVFRRTLLITHAWDF